MHRREPYHDFFSLTLSKLNKIVMAPMIILFVTWHPLDSFNTLSKWQQVLLHILHSRERWINTVVEDFLSVCKFKAPN